MKYSVLAHPITSVTYALALPALTKRIKTLSDNTFDGYIKTLQESSSQQLIVADQPEVNTNEYCGLTTNYREQHSEIDKDGNIRCNLHLQSPHPLNERLK